MHIDFRLLYPTILISGNIDHLIPADEKDLYFSLQQHVRLLISKRKSYQQKSVSAADDEERNKWYQLQLDTKIAHNSATVNCQWFPLIQAKAREIVDYLDQFLTNQGCHITSKDIDSVIISQPYDIDSARKHVQDQYGSQFELMC